MDKMMKWRLACFFAWILIMGSIVFELKFTDHDPDGRQIIALVAFTITLAFYPGALFEGDKRVAIVLLVFAAISITRLFF